MTTAIKNTSFAPGNSTEYEWTVKLLQKLIATPSYSREESGTAHLLHQELATMGLRPQQHGNNVWVRNRYYHDDKPTILLNSHHDTVKPNSGYTRSPFQPEISEGKLFGLGSNDAGGSLVALLSAFLQFHDAADLAYNLVFAATAEEEISGPGGISSVLPLLGKIDCAIVGEPTSMNMAVAEKGLLVLDCTTEGTAGHVASPGPDNAIYKALEDIDWFRNYSFGKSSELLGDCTMNVTVIQSGTQHNVIPASCHFTVDIRVNDCYDLQEIVDIIRQHVCCAVHPRSLRLKATRIETSHPLVRAGAVLERKIFGSGTLSDKALMPFPALKMGPGDTTRSHMADEFIWVSEIEEAINIYTALLKQIL